MQQREGAFVKQLLGDVFGTSLKSTFPTIADIPPIIACCNDTKSANGDYQCNNAMSLFAKIKETNPEFRTPKSVGEAIMKNLPESELIDSCSVTGPGFVNIVLSKTWLAKSIQKMLIDGIETWAPKLSIKRALMDFSSPNIAKQMHVGHLRSTIIGDTLAKKLEFSGLEVLLRNHVRYADRVSV